MYMKLKVNFYIVLLILALLSVFSIFGLVNVCFASEQEIEFKIFDKGDVSGYCEEAYFVVKNEADWVRVWEKHTFIREPKELPLAVDFSVNFVVCAFMGQRPTTGYSIDVERVWTDGKHVFVEVLKRRPPKGFAVDEMITCPYVMVLIQKTDMPFVFHVVDENGDGVETIFSEFPSTGLAIMVLSLLCLMVFMLKIKKGKGKE